MRVEVVATVNGVPVPVAKAFDESRHPRATDGRFGNKPGGSGGGRGDDRPGSGADARRRPTPRAAVPEKVPSARAARARAAHKLVDRTIQRYAEEHNEPAFARAVGGVSFPDGEPIDVAVPGPDGRVRHGVELKTMVDNRNNKITMKAEAQARKAAWERANRATFHTVVFDDSAVFNAGGPGVHDESKRRVFYRRGYGSFRVGGMYEVPGGVAGLPALFETPNHKLPPAARRAKAR